MAAVDPPRRHQRHRERHGREHGDGRLQQHEPRLGPPRPRRRRAAAARARRTGGTAAALLPGVVAGRRRVAPEHRDPRRERRGLAGPGPGARGPGRVRGTGRVRGPGRVREQHAGPRGAGHPWQRPGMPDPRPAGVLRPRRAVIHRRSADRPGDRVFLSPTDSPPAPPQFVLSARRRRPALKCPRHITRVMPLKDTRKYGARDHRPAYPAGARSLLNHRTVNTAAAARRVHSNRRVLAIALVRAVMSDNARRERPAPGAALRTRKSRESMPLCPLIQSISAVSYTE
jgi:hypothetical protein